MDSAEIPKSRLDTLPVEVLRKIFDMAFSFADDDSDCGSDCSDNDLDHEDDESDDEEDGEENAEDEEGGDGEEANEDAGENDDDDDDDDLTSFWKAEYEDIVKGLADDPLNSDMVRRLAREQLYSCFQPYSLEQLASTTNTIVAEPDLGRAMREVRLTHLSFKKRGNSQTDNADQAENAEIDCTLFTKEQNKRTDELTRQHKALFRSHGPGMGPKFTRPRAYERPAYWARSAVRLLDFLRAAPGLQEIAVMRSGMALVPMEEDEDGHPIVLRRLRVLDIMEEFDNEHPADRNVLDTDGVLMRCGPNVRKLEISGIGKIVSSRATGDDFYADLTDLTTASRHLKNIDELYLGHCPMTTTSLRRLLTAIGPRLADVTIDPPRRSPRPADNPDDTSRGFSTYDVLEALAPWQATSLTALEIGSAFMGSRISGMGEDFDQVEDEDAPGPSAMSILPGFTALRKFFMHVELFDWRGAGAYNIDGDTADSTARVAAGIVAQLPPNIKEFRTFTSCFAGDTAPLHGSDLVAYQGRMAEAYEEAWKPRCVALAQALVAATRAGRFPHLTTIMVCPGNTKPKTYEVKISGESESGSESTASRKITLESDYNKDIIAGRTPDLYRNINSTMTAQYDGLLRPFAAVEQVHLL